jgi:hypothetical protein
MIVFDLLIFFDGKLLFSPAYMCSTHIISALFKCMYRFHYLIIEHPISIVIQPIFFLKRCTLWLFIVLSIYVTGQMRGIRPVSSMLYQII